MTNEYRDTNEFRGGRFTHVDFAGARFNRVDLSGTGFVMAGLGRAEFRECDLGEVKVVSSEIGGIRLSGSDDLGRGVYVNDVDVSAFVSAELDRRHPERVQVRLAESADDFRAAWDRLERLWGETVERAERLPEAARYQRVDGEWSITETLRHLVFATDCWIGCMIEGQENPYHRLALPTTGYPEESAAALGMEPDASPPFSEAVEAHAERMARIRELLEGLTDEGMAETRTASPAPAWEEITETVRDCLGVLLNEHCEHRRYAERDLTALESQ